MLASGQGKVCVPRLLLFGSLRFKTIAAFTAEDDEAMMEAWWAGGGQMGSCMESTAFAAEIEPMVEGRWETVAAA